MSLSGHCIGKTFATQEALTVTAVLLKRFTVFVDPSFKMRMTVNVVLGPMDGLPVTLKLRQSN